jgi:hypothetical protein
MLPLGCPALACSLGKMLTKMGPPTLSPQGVKLHSTSAGVWPLEPGPPSSLQQAVMHHSESSTCSCLYLRALVLAGES